MKKNLFLLFIAFLVFSCNSDKKENTNDKTEQDTSNISEVIEYIEMPEYIEKTPNAILPLEMTKEEFDKITDSKKINKKYSDDIIAKIDENNSYFGNDIYIHSKIVKENFIIMLLSMKGECEGYPVEYDYILTTKHEGDIIDFYGPFTSCDIYESNLITLKLYTKTDGASEFILTYEDDVSYIMNEDVVLTKEEKHYLLTRESYNKIDNDGKILEAKAPEYEIIASNFYTGIIDNQYEIVMCWFGDHGKYFYKNHENELLLGNYYVPDMTAIDNLTEYNSKGKELGTLSFISSRNILVGEYTQNNNDSKPLKLDKSKKTYLELKPSSILAKVTNNDFAEYLIHFAETKPPVEFSFSGNTEANKFGKISQEYMKKYFPSSMQTDSKFDGATFHYGFSFEKDSTIICIIFIDMKARPDDYFIAFTYSYSGKLTKNMVIISTTLSTLI